MSLQRFRKTSRGRIDHWLLLAVLALAGFGLVMISSASVVLSSQYFEGNYFFVTRQALHLLIGLAGLTIFAVVDYRVWQSRASLILLVIAGLLILTHIPGIGVTVLGAQRWLAFGPVQFQPSEVVKILSILYVAAWLTARRPVLGSFTQGFFPFIVLIGLIGGLVLLQPDAGTTMVILGTVVTMYFVAGAPWPHLVAGATLGGSLLAMLILSAPYRLQRFLVFLNPSEETLGAAYHINQALLAVGAGGLLGLGFGQSKQKFLYLPEPHTDSIFAIALEELGFLRALIVLGLLLFIILRGLQVARLAPDEFGRLVAVGVTSLIAIQMVVNIGAMLGLLPLTGVTLPFVSYGGSSLVALLAGVGLLLNISRHTGIHGLAKRGQS